MKVTAIATFFTLVLGAVALPENIAERDNTLAARSPCPNGPSLNACNELCEGVVSRYCSSCTSGVCQTACEHGARMSQCLSCCNSNCVTC
ncbi:hypothetical protein VTK56DRAFT_6019 [Thermocarpiscus australiensis]